MSGEDWICGTCMGTGYKPTPITTWKIRCPHGCRPPIVLCAKTLEVFARFGRLAPKPPNPRGTA